jgi:hypothetical protein
MEEMERWVRGPCPPSALLADAWDRVAVLCTPAAAAAAAAATAGRAAEEPAGLRGEVHELLLLAEADGGSSASGIRATLPAVRWCRAGHASEALFREVVGGEGCAELWAGVQRALDGFEKGAGARPFPAAY